MNWIKCTDKLPDNVKEVLTYATCCDCCEYQYVAFLEDGKWYHALDGEELGTIPTHWQPLPKPPKT